MPDLTATVTLLSGCLHCGQLVCRGSGGGPWRTLPEPGKQHWPAAAITCDARPGRLPHQSPAEVSR